MPTTCGVNVSPDGYTLCELLHPKDDPGRQTDLSLRHTIPGPGRRSLIGPSRFRRCPKNIVDTRKDAYAPMPSHSTRSPASMLSSVVIPGHL
ncbi:hypothetical protein [Methanoculleus taiwanensis]|uniref:hypothetical protein n=1 Tax=Methanoculleus taiwanensis TaxID=1550565 RepID=UPI000FFE4994|nr:hypothetical protein [Methanoculleus taiwanensis]